MTAETIVRVAIPGGPEVRMRLGDALQLQHDFEVRGNAFIKPAGDGLHERVDADTVTLGGGLDAWFKARAQGRRPTT